MSTTAPPREGPGDLRDPEIVLDADERPVSMYPGLRTTLGPSPDGSFPGTLLELRDETSVELICAPPRQGSAASRDTVALGFTASNGGYRRRARSLRRPMAVLCS